MLVPVIIETHTINIVQFGKVQERGKIYTPNRRGGPEKGAAVIVLVGIVGTVETLTGGTAGELKRPTVPAPENAGFLPRID